MEETKRNLFLSAIVILIVLCVIFLTLSISQRLTHRHFKREVVPSRESSPVISESSHVTSSPVTSLGEQSRVAWTHHGLGEKCAGALSGIENPAFEYDDDF